MCVSAGTEVATASAAAAAAAVVNCTEGPASALYSEIASTDPARALQPLLLLLWPPLNVLFIFGGMRATISCWNEWL